MSTDKERETKDYVPSKMHSLTRFELMIYLAAGFFFFMSAYMTIASYDYLVDYYAGYDTTLEGKWGACLQYIAKQCGNWYGFTVLFFIAAGFAKRLEALAPSSAEMSTAKKATGAKDRKTYKEKQTVLAESKSAEDKAVAKAVEKEPEEEQVAEKESEKEKGTERESEKVTEKESEKEGKTEEESEKKKVTEKESKKKKAAKKKTDENTGAEKESKAAKVTGKETGAKNGSKKKGKEKKETK